MEFTLEEQFQGFLATSEIFAENTLFEYPLLRTFIPEVLDNKVLSPPGATVLGKRMEHFFACYLSSFTSEEILLQNQQIIHHKRTLGELDFLLKNSVSEEISHVELIYKFYLFDPATGTSELDHFIGPNKRDSLNRKLERLQKWQFPMLFQEPTRDLLRELHIAPEEVVQKMCFKAAVFLPKQFEKISFQKIHPAAVAGFWIHASDFNATTYANNKFFCPRKKYWPVLPTRKISWNSFDEIVNIITPLLNKQYAPLLWMKTPEGDLERFFVVWW
ncbi:DUF1853 family protein [Salinimicrobium oceani]|uniref:DUF1853 family protein n=1 Tax=Salinimicrobium oceani TaxID=2722702 RepID=A0ABX1CZQ0_9FLAO|nr:DUF1853 family protein [Salinimicrobium oceani]NJW53272.1 DUF1853 family protein [Salinimicrobium oceani]